MRRLIHFRGIGARLRGFAGSIMRRATAESLREAWITTRLVISRLVLQHPRASLLIPITLIFFSIFWYSLPAPLFNNPTCTVLLDRHGRLLAATIAADGQYRFPPSDSVPRRFATCLLEFEDRYFYHHPGVNPITLWKALVANVEAGRVVRGGSTLTMQIARMLHPSSSRSYMNKLQEVLWAFRLELRYRKDELLRMYASNAPFGGNVVGLDAASWRYYDLSPHNLSWAQSAALAVLPNAPAVIYPGRGTEEFQRKRDLLLRRLHGRGFIDSITLELSLQEPLPQPAAPLPQVAMQLLTHAIKEGRAGQMVRTTIDMHTQREAERIVQHHALELRNRHIYNTGAIIASVRSGEILAYVGNTPGLSSEHNGYVDVATGLRSTGSILKPFLYAAALEDGIILPSQLVKDIPTKYRGYSPANASKRFSGAVPVDEALSQSLNVPFVRLLQEYGIPLFLRLLPKLGLSSLSRSAAHYGLSLILGGGECTLLDICGAYAGMGRTLNRFVDSGKYYVNSYAPLKYVMTDSVVDQEWTGTDSRPLGAAAIFCTLEALRSVKRPADEIGWMHFSSSRTLAWKTGTSWGGRDAWAIGLNPEYVVGVWSGNAHGRSFSGGSGVRSAAPIMFHLFTLLPRAAWFRPPLDDMQTLAVCEKTGFPPNPYCPAADTILVPLKEISHAPCPYHELIHLDRERKHRVSADCYPIADVVTEAWFVLPPAMAWYYSRAYPYKSLPPWRDGCAETFASRPIQFLYPHRQGAKLSVPRDLDGKPSAILFRVAHQNLEATLYWHLDGAYVAQTYHQHHLSLQPSAGAHRLTLVDADGNSSVLDFQVVYSAK